jgi:Cysteine rich repeat
MRLGFGSLAVAAVLLSFLPAGAAHAKDPVQDALTGCATELKTHCSTVKPGGGRLVACMKAHEDKLSNQCVYALNRASYHLQSFTSALKYVALQCKADAVKHCTGVVIGEGRVLDCLDKNRAKIDKNCDTALRDVGRN